MEATHDALLTKSEAAQLLRVCQRTINNLITRQKIAVVKIGTSVRFSRADLAAFIESQRKEAK